MDKTEHLNLVLIKGYLETLDISILEQMLDLYSQQSKQYLTAIEEAIVKEDQYTWQQECHKMKGSAASAGLLLVHKKLLEIEDSTQDWLIKATDLQALSLLNQEAINVFRQWLKTG